MLNELKERLKELEKKLSQIRGYLAIDAKAQTIKDVECEIAKPDFWTDSKRAEKLINELKAAKAINEPYAIIAKKCLELSELVEIVDEKDAASINELEKDMDGIQKQADALEFKSLLSKREDRANAILSINAGAGGTAGQPDEEAINARHVPFSQRVSRACQLGRDVPLRDERGQLAVRRQGAVGLHLDSHRC